MRDDWEARTKPWALSVLTIALVLIGVLGLSPAGAVSDWRYTSMSSPVFGYEGPIYRFNVRVESSLTIEPDHVATEVLRALNDHRSWIGIEPVRFQLTTASDVDFTFSVATPATTDSLCRPLRTVGRLSCRRGRNVVVNANRWIRGPDVYHDAYANDVGTYRLYLVNHEVGHFIGKGHVVPSNCSASRRAPVMMQQTFRMRGCANNGWPAYDLSATGSTAEIGTSLGGGLRFAERRVRIIRALGPR